MDDLLQEFLTETSEALDVVDNELVRFEADPDNSETLNNIFRLVHTIKGTCGFLGLPRLEAVAHAGETLLGKFRDGVLAVSPDAVTLVLSAIDRIKEILVGLEASGAEPAGDDHAIIDALHAAAEGKPIAPPKPAAPVEPVGPNGERWDADMQRFLRPGEVSLAELEAAFRSADGPTQAPAPDVKQPPAASTPIPAPTPTPAQKPLRAAEVEHEDEDLFIRARDSGAQTIRVSVELLEQLMTTVSELVLTRNQLLQMVRSLGDSEFKAPLQRLSNITAELQDRVMKTRMQPVGGAWRKLPRIVRDICRETGKKIELALEGEGTELDRQVLELIKDPLTHMIRNAADHGIETPAERLQKGKAESGTIRLSAHHEGGHIIMLVEDDGAGLNTDRIRAKAVERGLATATEVAAMTEAQIQRFIFAPGFSTAKQVTNLSGRGVGMDVVKTNIELIGGSIELSSVEGLGATFRIKIPLTLAIVSALILRAGGQRFAAPQTSVLELVRVGGESEQKIAMLNAAPVLRLRERLLPLIDLSDVLQLAKAESAQEARFVVVMQVGAQRFGVVVDEVCDTEEIVVKPLSGILRGVPLLSGATILGDGSVVVILDPNGLASKLGRAADEARAHDQDGVQSGAGDDALQSFVLFRAGAGALKAVPLRLVTRLEEIDASTIEWANGAALVQYRGALTPLVHVCGDHAYRSEGAQPALMFSHRGAAFGIAVDEIVDVVHEKMNIELATERAGILGAAVMRGKATEIVDVGYYLEMASMSWKDRRTQKSSKGRVLLVDPSDFTRHMLAPLLEAAGYEACAVDSFDAAWRLNEKGLGVDAILTDVDADPVAATQFAAKATQDPKWNGAAHLLLSSGDAASAHLGEVVMKSDRAGLLAALAIHVDNKRERAA